MPRNLSYGSESEANRAIGGVPTIHYFDFQSRGRGQAVRLLLIDAGAAFTDVRYSFEEWPEEKRGGRLAEQNPRGTIPVVEMPDGTILTQSYAILRHWARQLGAYDGKTEMEKYWADVICDIVVDWRTLFISAFFSQNKEEDYAKHQNGDRKNFLEAIERHLKSSDLSRRGPYVIGNDITYADLVLFQLCHDENLTQDGQAGLKGYPRIAELTAAVASRENVHKFLNSDAYQG